MNVEQDAIYTKICQVVGKAVMLLNESKHNISSERISVVLKEQRDIEQEKYIIAIYGIAIDLMAKRN